MTRTRFHMLAPTTSAAVAALSACATIQPNQNIVDAQLRLSAAYNEKMTAERGQGDLANAKGALTSAQIAEKDDHLSAARDQLRVYNMKITQLGATMVLDDVSFETASRTFCRATSTGCRP